MENRVPAIDSEIQPRVPHHRAYGFDFVPPSMRCGLASFSSCHSSHGIVHGGSVRTWDKPAYEAGRSPLLSDHMLPVMTALGSTSPAGVIGGLTVRHAVSLPSHGRFASVGHTD